MIKTLNATLNETRKGLLVTWEYKFELLTQIIMLALVFIFVNVLLGQGRVNHAETPVVFIGYMVWFYAFMVIGDMGNGLLAEGRAGTLEQLYMSPAPSSMIMMGRALATVISTTVAVGAVAVSLKAFLGLQIPLRWEALPLFMVTVVGLLGFGFVISGAALLFKQIDSLANLLQNALLFLNGALLPVEMLPTWLRWIAQILPTTQGIVVMRNVLLKGQSLSEAMLDGSLMWLMVQSVAYLLGGWLIFKWCERVAKRRGVLGQY